LENVGGFTSMASPVMIMDILKSKEIAVHKPLLHKNVISLISNTENSKNVLLSYMTTPFKLKTDDPKWFSHTNIWECLQIVLAWIKKGYNVDIIDWDNKYYTPLQKKYSVFIDIHSNMERIVPILEKDCIKILHITGAHWQFQNDAEMKRLSYLKMRRGIQLKPRRQVPPSLGIEYADCATILGNRFTQGTFAYSGKPLYPIPISTTIQFPYYEKDYDKIRKNFLWFGSSGLVLKGLDIVLEAFSKLPDYRLIICGPINQEADFEKAYFKELYQLRNINTLGFIDVRSEEFLDVIKSTNAIIHPSCSEGQAGSVVTCLHAGLIPVISYESGVDVDNFGIILENVNVDQIIESVILISQKPTEELQRMSKSAWQYARTHHTREKFAQHYDMFMNNILK
jgi:glycosyltransferase involved in cell wall biosynthesis